MEIGDINLGFNPFTSNSFTPVRRRNSTLSNGRLQRDFEVEWKASRCNRLLRPLRCNIASLRKEQSLKLIKKQSNKRTSESNLNVVNESGKEYNEEANWIGSRKRVKRTYSGKVGRSGYAIDNKGGHSKASSNTAISSFSGEIIVPTPLLNRALKKHASPYRAIPFMAKGQSEASTTHDNDRTSRIRSTTKISKAPQALRDFRKTTTADHFNLYERIYKGLETLLDATQSTAVDIPRRGPKSLLSLCLNSVPKYISMEEETLIEETRIAGSHSAIEKRDISSEVYDDLEMFGSLGRGWTELQSVVRAHGIYIICNAISEHLLEHQFCEKIIELCIQSSHHEEGELLLSSLLSSCKFPAPKTINARFGDNVSLHPLSIFWRFIEETDRTGYQYRELSILIRTERLPLLWLATQEFTGVWTGIIQALSADHSRANAVLFLDVVLPRLVEFTSPNNFDSYSMDTKLHGACRHTLLSLLTTISSITILSNERDVTSKQPLRNAIESSQIHSKLLRDCLTTATVHAKDNETEYVILLLANLVTEDKTNESIGVSIGPIHRHLRTVQDQYNASPNTLHSPLNEAANFIALVARCCGKGASNSGFEYLEHIHQLLRSLVVGRESEESAILYEILVDSAFTFAQQVPGQKYLDYAVSIDGERQASNFKRFTPSSTEKSVSSPGVFRWEEGISAWVTATPAPGTSKVKNIVSEPKLYIFENTSPCAMNRIKRSTRASQTEKKIYEAGWSSDDSDHNPYPMSEMELSLKSRGGARRDKIRGAASQFEIRNSKNSDDELNSSFESHKSGGVLRDVKNMTQQTRRQSGRPISMKQQSKNRTVDHTQSPFSDDELCI